MPIDSVPQPSPDTDTAAEWEVLNELIGRIYDSVLHPERWNDTLARITGALCPLRWEAAFILWESTSPPRARFVAATGLAAGIQEIYTAVYAGNHPWSRKFPRYANGSVVDGDAAGDTYYAAARLDFASQPADGDTIVIGGTTYEFNSGGGVSGGNTAVTIGADVASTVANLVSSVGDPRVTSTAGTLNVKQIRGFGALGIDPSGTSAINQSSIGAITVAAITVGGTVTPPSNTVSFSGQPAGLGVAAPGRCLLSPGEDRPVTAMVAVRDAPQALADAGD